MAHDLQDHASVKDENVPPMSEAVSERDDIGAFPLQEDAPAVMNLIERLEVLLDRAPKTIATMESVAASCESTLQRTEERTKEAHRRLETTSRRITATEETCHKADRVQKTLNDFVSRLADIGDSSQEKIGLLLASLDAAGDAQEKSEAVAVQVSDLVNHLEPTADAYQKRLRELGDECVSKLREKTEAQIAKQRSEAQSQQAGSSELINQGLTKIKKLSQDQLTQAEQLGMRLNTLVDGAVATLEQASEAALANHRDQTDQQVARLNEFHNHGAELAKTLRRAEGVAELLKANTTAADAKSRQMASQLQAAGAAVQQVAASTTQAHTVLDKLAKTGEAGDEHRNRLRSAIETAAGAAQRLSELQRQVEPATESMQACLEGSTAAQEKIERLIQDVWTLTTTTQERARQLSGRSKEATQNIEKLEEMCAKASQVATGVSELIAEGDAAKTALHDKLREVEVACGDVIARQRADEMTARITQAREIADAIDTKGEEATRAIEDSIQEAQTRSSEAVHTIEERIQSADNVRDEVPSAAARGTKIKQEIESASKNANEACREVAGLLATLAQRRDIIESSDQELQQLFDRADTVSGKLRQLQTRTDAFGHQLNSMLANPSKIVEDARMQAAQLEPVCRALRKVFAGLSRSSLQANRDISRFARMNREADGRLTRLSSETQRTSETLREWVSEATRAQSQLAKLLSQVPPISQTHPTEALDSLATASSESIPEIMRTADDRRIVLETLPDARRTIRTATVRERPMKNPTPVKEDIAALIREAEEAAQDNS